MQHKFTKHNRKSRILMAIGAVVVIFAVYVIGLVAYTLFLRTRYKETVHQIAVHTTEISPAQMSITFQGETLRASDREINYYLFVFMLSPYTVPYNRAKYPSNEDTIVLTLGDSELKLTPLPEDDHSRIHVSWQTPEKEICYSLRSQISFIQLRNYYTNLQREQSQEQAD